jgi:hypothetical protein
MPVWFFFWLQGRKQKQNKETTPGRMFGLIKSVLYYSLIN